MSLPGASPEPSPLLPLPLPPPPPRYEVNPDLVPRMEEAGLMFVGRDESGE